MSNTSSKIDDLTTHLNEAIQHVKDANHKINCVHGSLSAYYRKIELPKGIAPFEAINKVKHETSSLIVLLKVLKDIEENECLVREHLEFNIND